MPTFKVTQVIGEPREYSGKNGPMLSYKILGSLDGGREEIAQISTTKNNPKVPFPGEEISCTIYKDDPNYGKTLSRSSTTSQGTSFAPRGNDPEVQASIIRQNALTNAVNYCIAKAQLMAGKEGVKYLDGKHIVEVATYFARFSQGKITFNEPEQAPLPQEEEFNIDDIEI